MTKQDSRALFTKLLVWHVNRSVDDELLGPTLVYHGLAGLLNASGSDCADGPGTDSTTAFKCSIIILRHFVLFFDFLVGFRLQSREHFAAILIS